MTVTDHNAPAAYADSHLTDESAQEMAPRALTGGVEVLREVGSVLRLSEAGYVVYDQVAPLALEFEQHLLGDMPAEERALLFRLLDRLDELELRAESEATPG